MYSPGLHGERRVDVFELRGRLSATRTRIVPEDLAMRYVSFARSLSCARAKTRAIRQWARTYMIS